MRELRRGNRHAGLERFRFEGFSRGWQFERATVENYAVFDDRRLDGRIALCLEDCFAVAGAAHTTVGLHEQRFVAQREAGE